MEELKRFNETIEGLENGTIRVAEKVDGKLPADIEFIKISGKNLAVDAVKKAQDGRGYIIRVVEEEQRRGLRSICLGFDVEKVYECNMIEEDKEEIAQNGNEFEFAIKPFEVKTFRII